MTLDPPDRSRHHTRMKRPVLAAVRRATPGPLVHVLVRARTHRGLRDPKQWDRARAEMRFVLGDHADDDAVERAAHRYIEQWYKRAELRWRPRMIAREPVRGVQELRRAAESGRGVVLNFMHHAGYEANLASVGRAGVPSAIVIDMRYLDEDIPDSRRQNLVLGSLHGCRCVLNDMGTQGILSLVKSGEVVALASDVAGRTPVRFLGRELLGSSGAARIARMADAPVVVMTGCKDNVGRTYVQLGDPLEPSDFASVEDLLAEMLAQHESAVRAWPEAYDSPVSRWGVPG